MQTKTNPPDQETIFKILEPKAGFAVKTIIKKSGLPLDYVYHRYKGKVKSPLTEEDRQKLWDAIPDKNK